MMKGKFQIHIFYCINCGRASYPLPRKISRLKDKFHRKKLFCPNCKIEINHVECRNEVESYEFKQKFEAGEFKEEAEASLAFIGDSWVR